MLRGVGIDESAIGAPYDALSIQLHGFISSSYVTNNFARLEPVEHCLPVMVKQPVRGVADAHVSRDVDHSMIVSSKNDKCKLVGPPSVTLNHMPRPPFSARVQKDMRSEEPRYLSALMGFMHAH
jgi:hypothetical protein